MISFANKAHIAKAIPVLGAFLGFVLVVENFYAGNYQNAAREALGMVTDVPELSYAYLKGFTSDSMNYVHTVQKHGSIGPAQLHYGDALQQ